MRCSKCNHAELLWLCYCIINQRKEKQIELQPRTHSHLISRLTYSRNESHFVSQIQSYANGSIFQISSWPREMGCINCRNKYRLALHLEYIFVLLSSAGAGIDRWAASRKLYCSWLLFLPFASYNPDIVLNPADMLNHQKNAAANTIHVG